MRDKLWNVLVTGGGGDIGQSIGKILKSKPIFGAVYATDLHKEHAGVFIFDDCFVVDRVTSERYVQQVNSIITAKKIDILISASEPELRFFLKTKLNKKIKVDYFIKANELAMEVGFDKLNTALFLKKHHLPHPKTLLVNEVKNIEIPCILKSRSGSGSKDLIVIRKEGDFNFFAQKNPDFICQEYLSEEEGEYTCGLFRSGDILRTIIFSRKLQGGYSSFGTIEENDQIEQLLSTLAIHLNLEGSINVQLRIVSKVPYVFEINPRFSSTVMFRHLFGFEDLIWSIQAKMKQPISNYIPPSVGRTFYKGFSEYVL